MSPSRWLSGLLLASAVGVRSLPAQAPTSVVLTPTELFEKVSPCVVKIVAKDEDGRPVGTGSGFVISAELQADADTTFRRLIVTNQHVIRAAARATVDPPFVPPSSSSFYEENHLCDRVNDVAVEDDRADLAVLAAFGWKVPALPLAEDTLPSIGTQVFVISSPEGLKNTLSEGIVSGYRELDRGERLIQITAPVSEGSSGGPVLTSDGKVIGVVVASHREGQNLNFAVPVSALRRVLRIAPTHRPLWKGTSITDEEDDAFVRLVFRACDDACPDHDYSTCEERVRAKEESGDQLALLVKAHRQYNKGNPGYCDALPTLKLAVQARACDYEYLAYFYLGKLMSDFCGPCIVQKKSYGSDEMRAQCYDPAIPLLKKSTQLNPKFSPSFARVADMYLETERYPEALVAAEFLVALVPNCWEAYLLRGKAFAKLRRVADSDEDFATAARLRSNWFDLYAQVARTYSHFEHRKAVDAAARALSLPLPTDEKELELRQQNRLYLWYTSGLNYELLGDLDNAARAFEQAHQLSPGRYRQADIEQRIARCRAGLPGDGQGSFDYIVPK